MVDINKIQSSLHPLERKILPLLQKFHSVDELMVQSALKEVEVARALQWLRNKSIIEKKEDARKQISLDKNGQLYARQGLPERRFLSSLNREMSIKDIERISRLSREEVGVSLGILKKKNAINISKKGNDVLVSITDTGRNLLKKDSLEEQFLKKQFPLDPRSLSPEESYAFNEFMKRKSILKIDVQKAKTASLTRLCEEIIQNAGPVDKDVIDSLTQELIKNKSWQGKEFRAYDIKTPVPKISYGKKHFENEAIEYIKSIWLNLGFKEMSGSMVQTAFWDLDALFVPQDHPAREMQDTFYLHGKAKLPELWKKVKEVHENGADTGSRGWRYQFSKEETEQILLRTHTTVLSAQTIANLKKENLPAKFFAIGKVFRNEALDWK